MSETNDNYVSVIDINDWVSSTPSRKNEFIRLWNKSFHDLGFILITGHSISHDLFTDLKEEYLSFFDAPDDIKLRFQYGQYGCSEGGYTPPGIERVENSINAEIIHDRAFQVNDVPESESNEGFIPDNIESVVYKKDSSRMCPIPVTEDYFNQVEILLKTIHRISAAALGLENPEYFNEFYFKELPEHPHPESIIRNDLALKISHYFGEGKSMSSVHPKLNEKGEVVAYGEHTDYQGFTILCPDQNDWSPSLEGSRGLQVWNKSTNDWIPICVKQPMEEIDAKSKNPNRGDKCNYEDVLVVNAGDLIQRWTNDYWISSLHRVIGAQPHTAAAAMDRYSIVVFSGPHPDAIIEPINIDFHSQSRTTSRDETENSYINSSSVPFQPLYDPIRSRDYLEMKIKKGVKKDI